MLKHETWYGLDFHGDLSPLNNKGFMNACVTGINFYMHVCMYNDMYLDIVNQRNDINLVLEPTRKGRAGGGGLMSRTRSTSRWDQ